MFRIAICDNIIKEAYSIEEILIKIDSSLVTDIYFSQKSLFNAIKSGERYEIIFTNTDWNKDGNNDKLISFLINDLKVSFINVIYIVDSDIENEDFLESCNIDFINKPITFEKIKKALNNVFEINERNKIFFSFNVNGDIINISYRKILYFKCSSRKINIVTDEEVYEYYGELYKINFPEDSFIKIHKSYIINSFYVKEYDGEYIKMVNGTRLSVSRNFKDNVSKVLLN